MRHERRDIATQWDTTTDPMFSRRSALSCSGLTLLGALSGSALGGSENQQGTAKGRQGRPYPPSFMDLGRTDSQPGSAQGPPTQPPKESQKGPDKVTAFIERIQNARTDEERRQVMDGQLASGRQAAIESLRTQLRVSDQEWSVIKPRIQIVYELVHPWAPGMGRNEPPKTEVEQRSRELRELLREEKAEVNEIKAKLTALRAAKERGVQELVKARQNLRQLMTLRQEALLVLNGLLD